MRQAAVLILVTLTQLACAKQSETANDTAKLSGQTVMPDVAVLDTAMATTQRVWELVALGEGPAPKGGGGKPATMSLDTVASRVSGFAGCNRYSGSFTRKGDSLTFGPLISTKMFCQDGDALERQYLAMLPNVRTLQWNDTTLTLLAAGAPLATFHAR